VIVNTCEIQLAREQVELARQEVQLAREGAELARQEVQLARERLELAQQEVQLAREQEELARQAVQLAREQAELARKPHSNMRERFLTLFPTSLFIHFVGKVWFLSYMVIVGKEVFLFYNQSRLKIRNNQREGEGI